MRVHSLKHFFWGHYSATGFVLAAVALVLDQMNKLYMLFHFWPGQGCEPFDKLLARQCKFELLPNLDFVMVWNEGISYGLFQQDSVLGKTILVVLVVLAIIALTIWLAKSDNKIGAAALGLVIGGAIGNGIDRAAYGAVADFFSAHAFGYYWYVFNIADAAIVAGVIGLLYDAINPSRKNVSNAS